MSIKYIQNIVAEKEFECCLAVVKADQFSFVISCLYKSPQCKFEEPFLNKLEICVGT